MYARVLTALLAGALPLAVWPEPRVPSDTEEILEQLPARLPVQAADIAPSAANLQRVQVDTLALLQLARSEGDPRYLGYASARLAPWLSGPEVAPQLRLLQAQLDQANHHFESALLQLQKVLQQEPYNSQALLMQAAIYLVRAEYLPAHAACTRLQGGETLLLAMVCAAQVDGLTGQGEAAFATLSRLASLSDSLTADQQAWLFLALGDLAVRLGHNAAAGDAYRRVYRYSPDTQIAWADWLLDNGRAADVVELLGDQRRHDGMLLRLARAEKALNLPLASADRRELAARFAALALRAESTHLREEAVFVMQILGDQQRALDLARANWQQQREPADVRIYMQTAIATDSRVDLQVLKEWLHTSGLEDVHLAAIAAAGSARLVEENSP